MRAARFLVGGVLLIAILAMTAYLLRMPIAGFAARRAMAAAGLENPQASVTALSLSAVRLENVAAGPSGAEAFRLRVVEADYDWRRLWSAGDIKSLWIGPGTVRVAVSPDGRVSLPGVNFGGGGGRGGAFPVARVRLADIGVFVDAPQGKAAGTVDADYDVSSGGRAAVALSTDLAGYQAFRIENGSLRAEMRFEDDGDMQLTASFQGDAVAAAGALRDIDVAVTAQARSWRDLAAGDGDQIVGEALIAAEAATLRMSESPVLAILQDERWSGAPISSLSFRGALLAEKTRDGFALRETTSSRASSIRADTGAALRFAALDGGALYEKTENSERAAFAYVLESAKIEAQGSIRAEKRNDAWRIAAPAAVGQFQSDFLSFDDATVLVEAETNAAGLDAEVSVVSTILAASAGRLNVFDTPVDAFARVAVNTAARTASVTLPKECLAFDRVNMTIDGQDAEAALTQARLCALNAPLAVFEWSDDVHCAAKGALSASSARYRLGRTRVEGRPPQIDFDATYRPGAGRTRVSGAVAGGAMTLNETMDFSRAEGRFDFLLDPERMRSTTRLDRVRIAQNLEPPQIAPVIASGDAVLVDKGVTFAYVLHTPESERLGEGSGVHDVETARGETAFRFDRLEFAQGGLQPRKLAPVLRGVTRETTGAATGSATFAWSPSGVASVANISFHDITFSGPTRIVTKTAGVNGDIRFADLWPVKTDGVQTITVDGVDLFTLQLFEGEISFDMPGDETLRVEKAVFPWFGGVLGAYNANASLSGGEAVVALRAEQIDLAQVLEYANVDGLSGEGVLDGVLPLVVENGKARIENGVLTSAGAGAIRYTGEAGQRAAATGRQAQIAFDLLRDLRFNSLGVSINGPLDGRLGFQMRFEGTGEVGVNQQNVRVPVIYRINLDAALLELLNQANMSRNIELQIERALAGEDAAK